MIDETSANEFSGISDADALPQSDYTQTITIGFLSSYFYGI